MCCTGRDIDDAKSVALKIGFPHYTLNYEDKFFKSVLSNFADEYLEGRTPSPCVRCNQSVKFADLLSYGKKLGAKAVVTGHYARYVVNKNCIAKGVDMTKDQSYFLSLINRENLQFVRFPLGDFHKSEIREIANRFNLCTAKKAESQDLCFVQNNKYAEMIQKIYPHAKEKCGVIISTQGQILGYHDGISKYTVGQRKGLNLPNGPWFVIRLNSHAKQVIVGKRHELARKVFYVDSLNWMMNYDQFDNLSVKVRARHSEINCKIEIVDHIEEEHQELYEETSQIIENNIAKVTLNENEFGIAPGQICAFYANELLVGGGRIIV